MNISDDAVLERLGAGEPIDSVCAAAGMAQEEFDVWWGAQLASRLPDMDGSRRIEGVGWVEILRDKWGIPHVYADGDDDLFFGYGFAMAQDRLWQLDYFRRKAMGRLSEVLGPAGLELDVIARTVGINRVAAGDAKRLPADTLRRLEAFSRGINAAMSESRDRLPIEFDLLGYAPEPWTPVDSIAIWAEFRWYLTGRLPVIVLPELARRALGDGPLYQAFLTGEAEDESILPEGSFAPRRSGVERVGEVVSDAEEGLGSNNWVIGGERSVTGLPMVASDPHIAFGSVSCWYEVHLSGAGFNVVGTGYAGVPGVIFGRNERVAWGVTNNICAQRDLYQEREVAQHPGSFYYDGEWEPAAEIEERITVKGASSVTRTVRVSRNGPIVDELLPHPARATGPVSLRWMGHEPCDEITSMLAMNKAASASEFREALRTWTVPTWSFGFADVDGHIGYQAVGRIPIKESWGRGYRPGWDPDHQWRGAIPFDGMPALADPPQGWVRSANNRTAPEDFPYPLSGVWSSGYRARRIRQMIEEKESLSRRDIAGMQMDTLSLRAVDGVPGLLMLLDGAADPRVRSAATLLDAWDRRMEPDSVGASIFEVFFRRWTVRVAAERFDEEAAPLLAGAVSGLSTELLSEDRHGWFADGDRGVTVLDAMNGALDDLAGWMGHDMSRWTWGGIHKVSLAHRLSDRGQVFQMLDRGGDQVGGSVITVCNTGIGPTYMAAGGANFRLNAELADDPPGLWAVDAAGQSGHPASPNYCDQLSDWLAGRYHYLPLDRERVKVGAAMRLEMRGA